jgi:hypothetical protein
MLWRPERVSGEIARLELTIKEQEETNEKLRASVQLREDEATIMQQIIKVRDREVVEARKVMSQRTFERDCLRGDVEELQDKVRVVVVVVVVVVVAVAIVGADGGGGGRGQCRRATRCRIDCRCVKWSAFSAIVLTITLPTLLSLPPSHSCFPTGVETQRHDSGAASLAGQAGW